MRFEFTIGKAGWYRLQRCVRCGVWMELLAVIPDHPHRYAHYDCLKSNQTRPYDQILFR